MAETGCLKDGHFQNLQVENLEVVKLNNGQAGTDLNLVGLSASAASDIATINGDHLTSGKGLSITSSSGDKTGGGLLEVIQTGGPTGQASKTLVVVSSGTGSDAGAASFTSDVTDGNAVEIIANSLDGGYALNITAADATQTALNTTGGVVVGGDVNVTGSAIFTSAATGGSNAVEIIAQSLSGGSALNITTVAAQTALNITGDTTMNGSLTMDGSLTMKSTLLSTGSSTTVLGSTLLNTQNIIFGPLFSIPTTVTFLPIPAITQPANTILLNVGYYCVKDVGDMSDVHNNTGFCAGTVAGGPGALGTVPGADDIIIFDPDSVKETDDGTSGLAKGTCMVVTGDIGMTAQQIAARAEFQASAGIRVTTTDRDIHMTIISSKHSFGSDLNGQKEGGTFAEVASALVPFIVFKPFNVPVGVISPTDQDKFALALS